MTTESDRDVSTSDEVEQFLAVGVNDSLQSWRALTASEEVHNRSRHVLDAFTFRDVMMMDETVSTVLGAALVHAAERQDLIDLDQTLIANGIDGGVSEMSRVGRSVLGGNPEFWMHPAPNSLYGEWLANDDNMFTPTPSEFDPETGEPTCYTVDFPDPPEDVESNRKAFEAQVKARSEQWRTDLIAAVKYIPLLGF